jgi:hypothetical protein
MEMKPCSDTPGHADDKIAIYLARNLSLEAGRHVDVPHPLQACCFKFTRIRYRSIHAFLKFTPSEVAPVGAAPVGAE